MSGSIDPVANPQAWDSLVLGGQPNPGLAIVSDVKRKHEWDVKKGKGTFGATTTFVGRPPAQGSVEILLWKPEHFRAWDTFRALLKYDPTKKSVQAVSVYHPAWADVDFKSVVTESIGSIVHKGKGLYSVVVDFLEFFPAPKKSAVSTPTSSATTQKGTTPGAQPDPIGDAQQREVASLFQTAQQP